MNIWKIFKIPTFKLSDREKIKDFDMEVEIDYNEEKEKFDSKKLD